nr:MAG TPA: hypothetical protein [Microviridae sp.]
MTEISYCFATTSGGITAIFFNFYREWTLR